MDEKTLQSDGLLTIGQNIKRIRLLKGLSQENIAGSLDKSINFISLVENGKTGLSIQTLIELCRVLEVDANSIFEGVIAPPSVMADDYVTKSLALFNDTDKAIVTDLITYIINSKN